MNILEQKVDLNAIDEFGASFNSDPLQVGNDGKAMFTAYPLSGGDVNYSTYMQANISPTGPDGPFEEKWVTLPGNTFNGGHKASGVYRDLIPGIFVRVVVGGVFLYTPEESKSVQLTLRTEALSGSA